jgi:glycosyltransferase involved in cell wall biosynthesis
MTTGPDDASAGRRNRIAYLSFSTGQFDSRTHRMAASAVEAGYAVTVYARWAPGLPLASDGPGYRILRAPVIPELAVPSLRERGRRKLAAIMRGAAVASEGETPAPGTATSPVGRPIAPTAAVPRLIERLPSSLRGTILGRPFRALRSAARAPRRWRNRLSTFPVRPMAWAIALDGIAEPADVWHGMWAGSLPALERLSYRLGGMTVYDARDLYIHSRGFDSMAPPWKWALGAIERRWARRRDAVITVNDAYAAVLAEQFDIPLPPVVRNTPRRYVPPAVPHDLLRSRTGLPPTTAVVLYQGGLMTDRGIEEGMEAILAVPDAVLVLMGYGTHEEMIRALAETERYRERVRIVEPVPPSVLLDWTASADVMLMAIQPTTLNHRLTTPNKMWEAIAVGTPVVASDLPGMAPVVREIDAGVLVDPTSPDDIARGIRELLVAAPEERARRRERIRAAAAGRYDWESQVGVLLQLYADLVDTARPSGRR